MLLAHVDTARELVINRRNAESKFKKELYGEGLGNMYDGDREAAEKMRQYIEYQYEQGLYNSDPTGFSKIVADYNAHVELFQQHYKNTYGTSESDGPELHTRTCRCGKHRTHLIVTGLLLETELLGTSLIRLRPRLVNLIRAWLVLTSTKRRAPLWPLIRRLERKSL